MNILLAPSSYAPNIGGVEQMTRCLARELSECGHNITVVAGRWPESLSESDCIDNIFVHRLDYPLPSRHASHILRFAKQFKPTLRYFCRVVSESRTDVIHVHCLGPNTLYATLAARKMGIPLVITTHGELQGDDTSMSGSAFMRRVQGYGLYKAQYITACSEFTLRNIPYPLHAPRRVIYNAVSPVSHANTLEQGTPPFLFCAARLSYNKGIDVAIRAFAAIVDKLETQELWIAGDGAEREFLQALTQTLGVSSRVKFLGMQSQQAIESLMNQCLFYLCPSRNEGFGLANLEAMRASKAVVASHVGGIPEVVEHRVTGLLIDTEDVQAFSEAIVSLIYDVSLRKRLGDAGKDRTALFEWSTIKAEYLEVYRQSIK